VQRLDELLKEQKRQIRDARSRANEQGQLDNDESMGGALNSRAAEEAILAKEGSTEALLNKALVDQSRISVTMAGEEGGEEDEGVVEPVTKKQKLAPLPWDMLAQEDEATERRRKEEASNAVEEERAAEERRRDQSAYRDRKADLLTRLQGVATATPVAAPEEARGEEVEEASVTLTIAGKTVTCKLSAIGDEQLSVMTDQEFDAYNALKGDDEDLDLDDDDF
jgi:hypothetical protein